MGAFKKAQSEQAFLKLGLYGKTGSGKTLTSLLWAEGLAAREKKRIAYIDTERGTEFYAMTIPERAVHPAAFDFDRLITRSLMETIDAVESLDPHEHGVLVLDSITHLWEAAMNSYTGKRMASGGIPIHGWGAIKAPYKRLMSLFLDGNWHAIICGREGVVLDKDEAGELEVIGTKMKAEGETPHEPHVLGRMAPDRDRETNGYIIQVAFEKDRSGILMGHTIQWPKYTTIEPLVAYLTGGTQGQLGKPENATERDIEGRVNADEREDRDRRTLYAQIESALNAAQNLPALATAWDLTKGKKGRLGSDLYQQLGAVKDACKGRLLGAE